MTTKPKLIDEGESFDAADDDPEAVLVAMADVAEAARLEQEALDTLKAAGWPVG